MADVFISYRNTPDRRVIVRRLATILRAHEITVWWDYGLEAGESYRAQITAELANARVVSPLWCVESVESRWVRMEAELGKDKLVPARLQKVAPPDAFEAIQAADLIGWDGAVANPRLLEFVRSICRRLGRTAVAPTDMIEDLGQLPPVAPLPDISTVTVTPNTGATAASAHDFAFWKVEWESNRQGEDLIALGAIAEHAPPYFATPARARVAAIEAAREQAAKQERVTRERAEQERARIAREMAEREQAEQRYRAEGRIRVEAAIVHGGSAAAKAGWLLPGAGKTEWFKDLDDGPEMVVVPAGRFALGSPVGESERTEAEGPQTPVMLAEPFAIGRQAVTRGEFAAFVAATGHLIPGGAHVWTGWEWKLDAKASWRNPGFAQDDRHPVVCVNWEDASAYCRWLAERTGKGYRLLSEAEWEYACRAGTETPFWWGSAITTGQANYNGNFTYGDGGRKGEYRKATVPVDRFEANPWGLYQVHGNAWDWCADCWNEKHPGKVADEAARATGDCGRRVVRGGSWGSYPQDLRAANRGRYSSEGRYYGIGFRVGRTLTP